MNPSYDSMSIVELKQAAKTRRIKMYYTKKRHELIRLLSMPELPESFKIEKLTIVQLRQQAKEKGLRGFWGLSREEMVNLLYPTANLSNEHNQDDKNCDNSQEHKTPQSEDSK